MKDANKGFTLIELMVVVTIIGILAAIAYPSYIEYIQRAYRAEGQALLTDLAARQERYYAQNNIYITADEELGLLYGNQNSPTGHYVLRLEAGSVNDGGYILRAVQKFSDHICGELTLNALGVKGWAGSANSFEQCWR